MIDYTNMSIWKEHAQKNISQWQLNIMYKYVHIQLYFDGKELIRGIYSTKYSAQIEIKNIIHLELYEFKLFSTIPTWMNPNSLQRFYLIEYLRKIKV